MELEFHLCESNTLRGWMDKLVVIKASLAAKTSGSCLKVEIPIHQGPSDL